MAESLLTIPGVAERLQVSEKTVRRLLTRGEMPGYKIGGQYRISPAELDAWIRDQALNEMETVASDGGEA